MDVIFEGRLSQEAGIREVLQQIFDQAHAGRTILRLTALKGDDFIGRILISDGRHIVAASIGENRILGYPALKAIMDRFDCSFALLRVSPNDNLDLGTTLNIDLQRIIMLLPNLPDSPAGLFDEKGLLDKLFGDFDDVPSGPSQPKLGPPATIIQSATTQNAAFNMLEPFLSGGYPSSDDDDDDFDDDERDERLDKQRARERQRAQERHRERSQYDDDDDEYDDEDDESDMDFSVPPNATPVTPLSAARGASPHAVQENSTRLRQLATPPKQGMRIRIPYVPAAGAFVLYMLASLILAYLRPGFAESFSWSYSWASAMWDYLAPNRINVKQQTLAPNAPYAQSFSRKVNNERMCG